MDETLLLGGRVRLEQAENGLRASSDSVLLAASVAARPGARILDMGSGNGVVCLCLAARRLDLDLTGWEIDERLVVLARRNAALNGWDARMRFERRDILAPSSWQETPSFDHIVSNPPFHAAASADPSPDPIRQRATIDRDLEGWLRAAARALVHRGLLSLMFRADRLDRLLAALINDFGDIQIMPLWPKQGQPAKRVLIQASRGGRAPATLWPGIALHGEGNGYLPPVERVLRHPEPFAFAALSALSSS